MNHEEKSVAATKGWTTQTEEQRRARAMLMVAGQRRNNKWITNGTETKLIDISEKLPEN